MKKSIFCIATCLIASVAFAQSDRYENAMKANITMMDSMMSKGNALELAHNFERIATAEKTQWLPYYYAAYCTIVTAYTEKDNNKKDQIADQATEWINKADSLLGKENSETDVIKSMIATAHMTVDPQSRYMTYGQQAGEYIQKAESLDSTNPRPVLLQAQNKFYTPEQFGGGKDAAREFFDKADSLDRNFKPATDLSPNWGRTTIQYFQSQYK